MLAAPLSCHMGTGLPRWQAGGLVFLRFFIETWCIFFYLDLGAVVIHRLRERGLEMLGLDLVEWRRTAVLAGPRREEWIHGVPLANELCIEGDHTPRQV